MNKYLVLNNNIMCIIVFLCHFWLFFKSIYGIALKNCDKIKSTIMIMARNFDYGTYFNNHPMCMY